MSDLTKEVVVDDLRRIARILADQVDDDNAQGDASDLNAAAEFLEGINTASSIFRLTWDDVEDIANQNNLPVDLSEEEQRTFIRCLESGLECWSEIVQLSLMAAIVGRMDAPGAIGRANRFAATGDTNVLLEGLDDDADQLPTC